MPGGPMSIHQCKEGCCCFVSLRVIVWIFFCRLERRKIRMIFGERGGKLKREESWTLKKVQKEKKERRRESRRDHGKKEGLEKCVEIF
mmetsp:Transcript_4778/g.9600  ORF Transcript_4778/g.9600 Transcript_4778/m.9600 type:complete len:88 (-) Transcript_4778:146-409(-)